MKKMLYHLIFNGLAILVVVVIASSCTTNMRAIKTAKATIKYSKTLAIADIAEVYPNFDFIYFTNQSGEFQDLDGLLTIGITPVDSLKHKLTVRINWLKGWLPKVQKLADQHIQDHKIKEPLLYAIKLALLNLEINQPEITFNIEGNTTQNAFTDKLKILTFRREQLTPKKAKITLRFNWLEGIDPLLNGLIDQEFKRLEAAVTKKNLPKNKGNN